MRKKWVLTIAALLCLFQSNRILAKDGVFNSNLIRFPRTKVQIQGWAKKTFQKIKFERFSAGDKNILVLIGTIQEKGVPDDSQIFVYEEGGDGSYELLAVRFVVGNATAEFDEKSKELDILAENDGKLLVMPYESFEGNPMDYTEDDQ